MREFASLERGRAELQAELDSLKSQLERNQMGQFSTPFPLAVDILTYTKSLMPSGEPVRFLDPAFGTGSFFSALQNVYEETDIREAIGYEIDPHYAIPAMKLWNKNKIAVYVEDFTKAEPQRHFNLILCNPPYVRHHHIKQDKARLQLAAQRSTGIRLSGLSGLYCYFLTLTHSWMVDGAIAAWLIPSEFMTVNYGKAIRQYLLDKVTLLRIHRFDPAEVQFTDALVSSAVVWFRNSPPPVEHHVQLSYGGSIASPQTQQLLPVSDLRTEQKWTRFSSTPYKPSNSQPTIGEYFNIRRGLATGDNSFFILSAQQVKYHSLPQEVLRPILPSPRYLTEDEVHADESGIPLITPQLYLFDCQLSEADIKRMYPTAWKYLQMGKEKQVHQRYLCRHRKIWYAQEDLRPAQFICTYIGRKDSRRGKPFRFILNHSLAIVANSYINLYPKPTMEKTLSDHPELIRQVWSILNNIDVDSLVDGGRVYGGGLHKLEPKELANIPVPDLAILKIELPNEFIQGTLLEKTEPYTTYSSSTTIGSS